ncbi:MAG: phosphoribosylamine--glycine ligase [Chloroflexi bacterium]|nr:phosphoribosylamine--glycine ligase [Chloroflexota bacterium]
MNILVIGSGAREHALVWKLLLSREVREVFVAPGNGGTGQLARNLAIEADDFLALAQAIRDNRIDLVIVGPEGPLANGIADFLAGLGIPVFGPTAAAARLESSKWFAKEVMMGCGVLTTKGEVFTSMPAAHHFIVQHEPPFVVKADGLAAGKGVVIAHTRDQALNTVAAMMEERIFGASGDRVVIEEFLTGPEYSFFAFTDGETVIPMVPARDYKRVGDNDQGPNTGGMGSYSAPAFVTPDIAAFTTEKVITPVIRSMAQQGTPYRGILYAGMILTAQGPQVIEFNCRMGDPETQVVMPRLESDLHTIALACATGKLAGQTIRWSRRATVGVVMASRGYPDAVTTGYPVLGLDRMDDGVRVFHGGTRVPPPAPFSRTSWLRGKEPPPPSVDHLLSGQVETSGGRVLTVVATADTVAQARALAYANVARISFDGGFYRTDIAAEA